MFRTTPMEIRTYNRGAATAHKPMLESFTKEDYQLYEKLIYKYKRVDAMLARIVADKISGPVLELATIRLQDLALHQRLIQALRYRWTDISLATKIAFNNSPDKFWAKMAASIQRRCADEDFELYPAWSGSIGRPILIQFLKDVYNTQSGRCALSNEPMMLEVKLKGKNLSKCSPDRKNSAEGYTPSNIWFVVWWVNQMKMDTTLDVFLERIHLLATSNKIV